MTMTVAARIAARRLSRKCAAPSSGGSAVELGSLSRDLPNLRLIRPLPAAASAKTTPGPSTCCAAAPVSVSNAAPGRFASGGGGIILDAPGRRYGCPDLIGLRSFSTPPRMAADDDEGDGDETDPNVLAWPRNLTISRGATSSPFHGLSKVGEVGEMEEADMEGEGEDVESADHEAAAAEDEEEDDEDEYDPGDWEDEDEDDEEEEELYDLSTRPEPYRVVPLPERLHVPVYQLYAEAYRQVEPVGTIHLDPQIFGLDPVRVDLIHRVVRYQRNKKRGKRYPAKTKTIGEVRGSGRKVRQQKGLGRARAGHSRPAHWRGGAKAHGPKGVAQDYTTRLNKKVRKLGLRHALSQKLKEGNLVLFSDLRADSHKTKLLERALKRHGIAGKYGSPAFILDDAQDDEDVDEENVSSVGGVDINFKVASGNIRKIRVINQLGANVYDILNHEKLVLSLAALTSLEARLMP